MCSLLVQILYFYKVTLLLLIIYASVFVYFLHPDVVIYSGIKDSSLCGHNVEKHSLVSLLVYFQKTCCNDPDEWEAYL
jgi:hypothetical protein